MPKSSKPRGGRPSRNFDPRYAKQSKTPFSERYADAAGSRRRDSDDAASRGGRSGGRVAGRGDARAAGRDGGRGYGRDDRAPRYGRDERAGRVDRGQRYDRDDRAPRYGRDERPARDARAGRYDRDDRAGRYDRDDRAAREERGRTAPQHAGSRSPKHRGYRPAEAEAPKRRWTAQERAGRDEARSIRSRAVSGRKDSPHHRGDERPRYTDFARTERPRYSDSGRPERRSFTDRDDRRFGSRDDRPARDARETRAARDDRRFGSRDDRPSRDARDTRPARDTRDDRTRSDRGIRSSRPASRPAEVTDDVVHERLDAQQVSAEATAGVTFAGMGLGANIVAMLASLGAEQPFPIQAASIPAVMEGRDVLARGRTGSGKTIAFGAPLVERVLRAQSGKRREFGRAPRAIILAPTRELALQIDRTIQPIARSVGLFTTQVYGGVPQGRQVGALRKGVDIVIGTPGRIEDLIKQRKLDLSECTIAVLDEADHMCELGFVEPVQRILRHTAEGSQKLLFSATLDREVAALVNEFLVDPAVFEIAGETQDSGTIDHRVLVIEHRDKSAILTSLVDREGKTLVFARTRAFAEMLAEDFADAGIPAVSLHGDLNQAKRTRNLEKLTSGRVNVLVATDVAARGIHVDDIDLVIQADAPDEYKTYLHRSGRTGRAGRSGRVVTLITRHRRNRMEDLLARAEIDAPFEQARLGDEVLEELAGRMTLADLTA